MRLGVTVKEGASVVDALAMHEGLLALVARVGQLGPANWVQIYATFDAADVDEEPDLTWLMLAVVNLGDRWAFNQLECDDQVHDLAVAYRDSFGPKPWTTMELTVDYDGAFHGEQYYGRGAGEERFVHALVDRSWFYELAWTAEHGPAPHAGQR